MPLEYVLLLFILLDESYQTVMAACFQSRKSTTFTFFRNIQLRVIILRSSVGLPSTPFPSHQLNVAVGSPQYYEIYKYKEVIGISVLFMFIDWLGGVSSVISLAFKETFDVIAGVAYSLVVVRSVHL
jgi:PQ loop repeat